MKVDEDIRAIGHCYPTKNGSPGTLSDKLYTITFNYDRIPTCSKPRNRKPSRQYRNPVFLAREWQELLDNGTYESQAELSRALKTSRARVTQMLNILKLCEEALEILTSLGDPLPHPVVTERMVRTMVNATPDEQRSMLIACKNH
jgi:hypothetical protein